MQKPNRTLLKVNINIECHFLKEIRISTHPSSDCSAYQQKTHLFSISKTRSRLIGLDM